MFTGITHGVATVLGMQKQQDFQILKIQFPANLVKNLKVGASVSNNGCCLTVFKIKNYNIYFHVMQETLQKTNLILLNVGSKINIERSLKFGDEIGGHLMSGHIIGTAKILNIINFGNNKKIFFQINNLKIMKYIFLKGFIGIDGISLTVGEIHKNIFCIYFIPETISTTNIKMRKIGDTVNIEVDYYTQIVVDRAENYFKKLYKSTL
ncbi:riboflavin synthase subunit alpha [Buchnera aphidicola]|uniref:Riboflavin synthase n=1 Tax=Buchnera aphidicola (Sarucallis kahawaluokalani) TaxID=1241878 RepID=A0A4D6Y7J7_9GAMM|nr:riboflavin synthase subunit alpha [Buchnera aphidicola]QCI25886.1 riboflavin synthase subunit alpha [Buchnera aphidicola (Sarucallis kahawaluokalani)]